MHIWHRSICRRPRRESNAISKSADSAYKGPLCQGRNRWSELKPATDGKSGPPSGGAGPGPLSFRRANLPLAPGNTGGSRQKPTLAHPCTLARVVMNRTKRSDQAIILRRRSARMRRIDGFRRMAEMVQNPLDDGGFLDAGDDAQVPTALPAGLDINGEYSLEALCP